MLFINDICIGLLSQCNWHCNYCIAFDNSKSIDEEYIFNQLYTIRNKLKTLWISGGEPGLLSESFWNRLLDSIDFNLLICTNGTFIVKGYFDKFKDRIRCMTIHTVEELTDDIHPKVLDVLRNKEYILSGKVVCNIVVHKHNCHQLRDFLTKYSDITFNMNFTDSTFTDKSGIDNYDYAIDRESAMTIVKQLGPLPNYQRFLNIVMHSLLNNNLDFVNSWSLKNIK
jgi:organic radical activating enzyme